MFNFAASTVEDLQKRFAELKEELDGCSTIEDVNARSEEMDAINAELEARKKLLQRRLKQGQKSRPVKAWK